MGKHDAGRHARKPEKKSPKTLLWVILAVVLVAAVAAVLIFAEAFRPAEEAKPWTPEAMDAAGTEEEVFRPAEEERKESAGALPEEAEEAVLRLEAGEGLDHHVYIQQNPGGMAIVEYLVRGDVIVSSAESVYASVAGMDDMTVEGLAQGFTMTSRPEEYTDSVELLWERQGDWLIMVTVLEELDDPAALEAYGDHGLMRIVNDDSYTLAVAEEFLFSLGYEKQ